MRRMLLAQIDRETTLVKRNEALLRLCREVEEVDQMFGLRTPAHVRHQIEAQNAESDRRVRDARALLGTIDALVAMARVPA